NASRQSARFIGKAGLLVTLAAVGIAVDERLFSVEDSIYQYLPEFRAFFDDEPSKKNIRIRDLLTHRSGLSWNEIVPLWVVENGEIVPNQRNTLVQMRASDDWVSFTLERRLTNIGRYQFCTANGVLLAKILENASGVTFEKYIQERLFAPLEIIHPPIGQDQAGNSNGGDGYILSLLDLTKIGFLFLKRGVWKGRTLVNNNFAKDAMSRDFQFSQSATENSIGYFFTFFGSGIQPLLNIPYSEIVFFVSEDGSALFIAPEEDMVASIFSENPFGFNFPAGYSLFAEITRTIR
ncbi:MAG: serine hydrolase, partial [Bacteroidota bacterium]